MMGGWSQSCQSVSCASLPCWLFQCRPDEPGGPEAAMERSFGAMQRALTGPLTMRTRDHRVDLPQGPHCRGLLNCRASGGECVQRWRAGAGIAEADCNAGQRYGTSAVTLVDRCPAPAAGHCITHRQEQKAGLTLGRSLVLSTGHCAHNSQERPGTVPATLRFKRVSVAICGEEGLGVLFQLSRPSDRVHDFAAVQFERVRFVAPDLCVVMSVDGPRWENDRPFSNTFWDDVLAQRETETSMTAANGHPS